MSKTTVLRLKNVVTIFHHTYLLNVAVLLPRATSHQPKSVPLFSHLNPVLLHIYSTCVPIRETHAQQSTSATTTLIGTMTDTTLSSVL